MHSENDETSVKFVLDWTTLTVDHFGPWTVEVHNHHEDLTLVLDVFIMHPCSVDASQGMTINEVILQSRDQTWLQMSIEPNDWKSTNLELLTDA